MSFGFGYCFDREGNAIDLLEYARLHENFDYVVLRRTPISIDAESTKKFDPVEVSTVWLGIDHGFGFSEHPIIFETMIFGGLYDEYQLRYNTEEQALAGHEMIVKALENNQSPEEVNHENYE
jgi:hypothetical protein